jgi:hypothetical protein
MTCRANEVELHAYLNYLFEHLPAADTVEQVEALYDAGSAQANAHLFSLGEAPARLITFVYVASPPWPHSRAN